MDRITGNTIDLGGGRRGFRDRNLGLGQAGTVVDAAFLNAVQEELMAVLAAAGITPSASNLAQLLAAMNVLYGGGGTLGTNGWQRLPGGLVLQWGSVLTNASGQAAVTFPLAFPANFYRALINPLGFASAVYAPGTTNSQGVTGFNQNIVNTNSFALAPAGATVGYMAVGN